MKIVLDSTAVFSLFFLTFSGDQLHAQNICSNATLAKRNSSWLENIVPDDYNKQEPPAKSGSPMEVSVIFTPWSIGEISIKNMYFEVNVYIMLVWSDDRLNIPSDLKWQVLLPEEISSHIWTPHMSFRNCMGCAALRFDPKTDRLRLIGKTLKFNVRKTEKLFCDFDISNYPMDVHHCSIEVEPFSDLKSSLLLKNLTTVHKFLRNSSIPQFVVRNHSSGECGAEDSRSDWVSCTEYRFTFVRKMFYYLLSTYLPSLLIVVLTWVSFWLDIDMSAPRVALGLTSLLTLTTQYSNAQKDLPPVSYLKAIDIWMVTCMVMVFSSLIEFALVFSVSRRSCNTINVVSKGNQQNLLLSKKTDSSHKIDRISRVAFPAAFTVFNICYWSYYGTR